MIRTLMRELHRSQGRYARSAFVLVLLAVALASFTTVSMATRVAEQSQIDRAQHWDAGQMAWGGLWTNGSYDRLGAVGIIEPDAFARLSADIHSTDPRAVTSEHFYAKVVGIRDNIGGFTAVDHLSPLALAEGRAPGKGEVAITPWLAAVLRIGIGDHLALVSIRDVPGTNLTLTVTGILRMPSSGAFIADTSGGVISLDDAAAIATSAGQLGGPNAAGEPTAVLDAYFRWDGPVPASAEPYLASDYGGGNADYGFHGAGETPAAALAALLTLATLVAAGVAGRNQGQARSQWVGTMRALGATRRDVVSATLLEAAIMGGAAAVLGGAIGWGINDGLVARTNARLPGTFLPSIAPYPAWALAVTVLIGLLLAGAIGAAPAYWAARTSPSEALKPTAPFEARPPRWRIPTRAYAAVTALAGGMVWLLSIDSTTPLLSTRLGDVAAPVALLGGVGLLSRMLGALVPMVGGTLARSRRPWLFSAGDSLRARPRQATGVATVFAVPGVGLGVASWISAVLRVTTDDGRVVIVPLSQTLLHAGMITLVAAVTLGVASAVVGLAVWMGRGRDSAEAATRGALGLGRNARQLAAMAESAAAAMTGGVVGVTLGIVGAGLTQVTLDTWGLWALPVPATWGEIAVRLLLTYVGALIGVALAAAMVSLWSARSVDAKTPAGARRNASNQGAA